MKKSPQAFWRFAALFLFIPVTGFFWINPALANGGPHGGFTATTDACAGCHRSHSAQTAQLLTTSEPGLCLSCHDGSGANTNVIDGTYFGAGLRGGGFSNALMDVALDNSAVTTPVTSSHTMNGSLGTMWGNGAINSGAGPSYFMVCTDCHNPHGESTYRMLRPIPVDSGATVPVAVPDQSPTVYTVSDPNNRYIGEAYGSLSGNISNWCSQCHTRYLAGSGSGHSDSGDAIFPFRHNTFAVPCIVCHVSHGTSATMGTHSGAVAWPDDSNSPNGDARSSLLRGNNRAICVNCHVDANGRVGTGGCNSCHDAVPATGAHLTHTDASVVGYGITGSYSNGAKYIFGCGECHSTDNASHQNGAVDVVLASTGAPAGSLKERNSPTAAFSGGTCGGVYCHSGEGVDPTGPVGWPLENPPGSGNYLLDSHDNPTFQVYTANKYRVYATTPNWVGGTLPDNGGPEGICDACHQFPLTTSSPDVQTAAVDSHQWIAPDGWGSLHGNSYMTDPIPCRTCHYSTVKEAGAASLVPTASGGLYAVYNAVAIDNRGAHVNGAADVVFDQVDPITFTGFSSTQINVTGTYYPLQNSCGNVSCHASQTYVVWGAPFADDPFERCAFCHRPGYAVLDFPVLPACITCHPSGTVAPSPAPFAVPVSKDHPSGACVDCHAQSHGK